MSYLGQRRVLIVSEFIMMIANFMIMLFYILNKPYLTIVGILLFSISYQASLGPVCFIHIQETSLPSTQGNSVMTLFVWVIITSFLGSALMDSFGPITCFCVFGILNLVNFIYTVIFVKETLYREVTKQDGTKEKVRLTYKEK